MAHGVTLGPEKKFFWNIDAHVGPGCPNRPEDVQLVQLGYHCMARNSASGISAQEKAVYMGVVPGAQYAGSPTDPLTIAIKTHQKSRGGTQDGRVSPIQNSSGSYGEKSWTIIPLCNNIKDVNRQQWPLLHRVQSCPAALSTMSQRTFN